MKPWLLLVGLAWLLLATQAAAEQHQWTIDNRFSSGIELEVVQTLPDDPVPRGHMFLVSAVAWSASNTIETVEFSEVLDVKGCEIVDETRGDYNTLGANLFAWANATLLMGDGPCTFSRSAWANDTVLGTVAEVPVVFTVVSYTMHDYGQDPTSSASTYAGPLLLSFAIFGVAWWRGLNKHPAWGLAVLVGFLAVLTHLIGVDELAAAAIPSRYAAIAFAIVALSMYVFGRMGFRRGRDENGPD